MSEPLLHRLAELAGAEISVGLSEVGSEHGLIDPEPETVRNAIESRRLEFAAGRRAAREALVAAGGKMAAIPSGQHRAPEWPKGFVGSISHDAGLAVACVARRSDIAGLGIDLTEATAFPGHLRNEILLTAAETAQSDLEARISFSAKESVFKAFYPDVGRYFGFGAVEIEPGIDEGRFTVTLRRPLGSTPAGTSFSGKLAIFEGRLLTLLAIPA